MFQLPVGISHKSESAVVPSHFSQEGEHEQQHLEAQDSHLVFTLIDNSFSSNSGKIVSRLPLPVHVYVLFIKKKNFF